MKSNLKRSPIAKAQMYLHKHKSGSSARISRAANSKFKISKAYIDSLPDMMHAHDAIEGANVAIQQVGVANFKLPLRYKTQANKFIELETSVTGSVSLEASIKGINMSRIMRSFYKSRKQFFTPQSLVNILKSYRRDIGSLHARLRLDFSYPILQKSLRSTLTGFQYYRCAYQAALSHNNTVRKWIEFNFIYSSACPCSAELAEHARDVRSVYSIPHSQRSRARLKIELIKGKTISIEDLQEICLRALKTETQVMVKREDEQAFAELNGTNLKFVEDAARLLYAELDTDKRIADFEVACSHFESLHSHDAVSVICKGVPGGFSADLMEFAGFGY